MRGEVFLTFKELHEYLRQASNYGKSVKQIFFAGERFDVMSVRRWRDAALNKV